MTYRALMPLDTVLKCSVAVIWVCHVVTAKVYINFVHAPQTHVIRHCDAPSTTFGWLATVPNTIDNRDYVTGIGKCHMIRGGRRVFTWE